MVLQGLINIDITTAEYAAASVIEFKFASLTMRKSGISAAILIDSQAEDRRGTAVKIWIKNNSLFIEKVTYFDKNAPITIVLTTAFAVGGQRAQITKDGYLTTAISNQPAKVVLNKKCLMVKDNYIFMQCMFKKFSGDTGVYDISMDFNNVPDDVDVYLPIVYSNPYVDKRGAVISIAHLVGGHLETTTPETITFTLNDGTFFQFFAVRTPAANSNTETE